VGEVDRVHGTYNSTFGHDFRHRVDAASKDKRRGSGGSSADESPQEEDVVELHEESAGQAPTSTSPVTEIDGLDFSA